MPIQGTSPPAAGNGGCGSQGAWPSLAADSALLIRSSLDPDAEFPAGMPTDQRYNAEHNPGSARATVYDHTVNVYGPHEACRGCGP
ncbi:DUF6351 family protein [Streptomyces sp. NPDC055692]|uniref:DUF6351 family protein n=1 Tax=Streptomyces sp. NPDC055692 TaxID=3155683 RepID=UPI00343C322F